MIDLSHPLIDGQPSFPGDPQLKVEVVGTVPANKYNLKRLTMGSHQGTHLDVPYHFFDDGRTIEEMPLERFFGPASLLDLAPGGNVPDGTAITVGMVERRGDLFEPGARVLLRTGWYRNFGGESYFRGFPTLTVEAARWIAERKIGLLGFDTPTPSTEWLTVHHTLLGKGVEMILVEGLTNLHLLPERFVFSALPLKIQRGDGSPVRACAIVE